MVVNGHDFYWVSLQQYTPATTSGYRTKDGTIKDRFFSQYKARKGRHMEQEGRSGGNSIAKARKEQVDTIKLSKCGHQN